MIVSTFVLLPTTTQKAAFHFGPDGSLDAAILRTLAKLYGQC